MSTIFIRKTFLILSIGLLNLCGVSANAQLGVDINLAMIDGVDIKPDNVLMYTIISRADKMIPVTVKGMIHYRNSDHRISYSFDYYLQPGNNNIQAANVQPKWDYSSSAIRDLFVNYNLLPQGAYEYCVTVTGKDHGEVVLDAQRECLYRQAPDIFMINLMEPENDAKIYEYNPLLSWVATYPFANELTYKIRVAEMKKDQNPYTAITRNNAIYSENNLAQTSIVYPIYAKQLKAYQPYAWTVDAYYKGVLLGGAEPWKFTIIEDTTDLNSVPIMSAYLNINKEIRPNMIYVAGTLRLKYDLNNRKQDTLQLVLKHNKEVIKLKENKLATVKGDNKYDIDLTESPRLKHNKIYTLEIVDGDSEKFIVVFKYINPDYLVK